MIKALVFLLVGAAAGALTVAFWMEKSNAQTFSTLTAQRELAASRIGAACSPVYGVFTLTHDCPAFIGSRIPEVYKPFLCAPRISVYRSPALEQVRDEISGTSPGAVVLVLEEKGAKERPLEVQWAPQIRKYDVGRN